MAGNEASEKLSWPWRKRGRRKENNHIASRRPCHALVLSRVGRQGREGREGGQCGAISVEEEDRPNRPIV